MPIAMYSSSLSEEKLRNGSTAMEDFSWPMRGGSIHAEGELDRTEDSMGGNAEVAEMTNGTSET